MAAMNLVPIDPQELSTVRHPFLAFLLILIPGLLDSDSIRLAGAAEPVAGEANDAVPVRKWLNSIQKLGASYQPGKTTIATDIQRDELISAIAKKFDGSAILIKAKVKDVQFRDGVASISTEPEFGSQPKRSMSWPLILNRSERLELAISKAEAAAIDPGDLLEFTGQLKFHQRRWGAVGRTTNSQQLYSVRHEYLKGLFLGTFTATKCRCKIDGKPVACVWAK
ncbi:hypothetical protein [Stieleria tagensis]|uniref:hypothetical protein n=1 Tax=Stieleria tagensis TaxID=2956795 RepID=UPI00209A7E86|nr:hypothetical protein [Stieleria tagensis]